MHNLENILFLGIKKYHSIQINYIVVSVVSFRSWRSTSLKLYPNHVISLYFGE